MENPTPTRSHPVETLDAAREAKRKALRDRHSQALVRLMGERADLRGVHALADLVEDSVRWSA